MVDLDGRKTSRPLWIVAAVAALTIHAGCVAFAVARLQADDASDDLGAPAIEIGLEMASPKSEATDLPPGPDTDASAASPAVAEQKAEVKETELPKDIPTETEDPDRVVTTADNQKPKEDEPEVAAVQQSASTESVASEATAMPTVEAAKEEQKSVAPARHLAEGTGGASRQAQEISNVTYAEGGGNRGQFHARSDRSCAVGQHRQGLGRCRVRRGGACDGQALRSGARAAACHRR